MTCELPTDPEQYVTVDGRWTFDARSRNHGKAFMLLWPDLRTNENDVTLGNIIERLLGYREKAIADGRGHALRPAAMSLAKTLSYYCNLIY